MNYLPNGFCSRFIARSYRARVTVPNVLDGRELMTYATRRKTTLNNWEEPGDKARPPPPRRNHHKLCERIKPKDRNIPFLSMQFVFNRVNLYCTTMTDKLIHSKTHLIPSLRHNQSPDSHTYVTPSMVKTDTHNYIQG